MATKLKNMKLSSVDLVKAGANQEADICLYKSAETDETAQEATESPTEAEKNIFKRFLGWLHESLTDFDYEPEDPIEKGDDSETEIELEPADIYKSTITESLQSIMADETLSAEEKNEMVEKSIGQYHDAMMDLVEKINHNHDALGRFASGPSGGGGAAASGKFNAKAAEDKLNEIGLRRLNGGAKKDDYKVLGETLHSAPVGTVYTETGDRGAKFQYTKTKGGATKKDDEWKDEDGNPQTSHNLSMTWGGHSAGSHGFQFDTADTAPTRDEVRDSRTNAANGQLRQWLGGKSAPDIDFIEEV